MQVSTDELKRWIPRGDIVARDLYNLGFRGDRAHCPCPQKHTGGDRDRSLRYDRSKERFRRTPYTLRGTKRAVEVVAQ